MKCVDVPGLCKSSTLAEIKAQSWSLSPGRYVGVAPGQQIGDEDFRQELELLNEEFAGLNAQARVLEETIGRNVAEMLDTQ
jgi:type I restriction enzyme M protein